MFLLSQIIVWLIIVYGITQIIVDSTLFEGIKNFLSVLPIVKIISQLMNCFLCASVWVSFLVSYFVWSPTNTFFSFEYQFFLDGMFGSCVLWFIRAVENKMHY